MTAPVIQFKRGALVNLPGLQAGEPGFTTDSYDFYIGLSSDTSTNKFFGSHRYWTKETTSKGSGVNLVEGTGTGASYITLKAPDSLSGVGTYIFPDTSTITDGYFLKVGSDGTLSWDTVGGTNGNFTSPTLSGITTVNDIFDVNASTDFSGITTFSNTTNNTLGDENTGAVQIDGGVGIAKNLTVKENLYVGGYSEFIGVATFRGGAINLGDGTGDNINVGGEFTSGLFPNDTATYDLGDAARQWRHANFSGVGTFSTGAVADNIQIGITNSNTIDTVSGNLTINSAGGATIIDDAVTIQNNLTVNGNVTVGGTTVTLKGEDVYIQNKDIILGYTTSITPNDDTANHAGVAIASTIGTPLVSFSASGINTLPDTYKQMMWFKSGTLGFATDAFGLNYGLAIGTTSMASGVRLAVGSNITMTDNTITATNGNFTNISVTNISGALTGTISTATRATTVDTTGTSTNADYFVPFVDTLTGQTGETVRVGYGLSVNPSTGDVKSAGSLSIGSPSAVNAYLKAGGGSNALYLFSNGDVSFQAKAVVNQIRSSNNASTLITLNDLDATFANNVNIAGITTIGTNAVVGTSLSAPTVKVATLQHSNGTQAATIDTSGNITASQNLTVSGNLYVNGSTTQVNTASITVEDRTIELGQVDGSAPSAPTTWDLGVLFNYNSSGAKKSGVIWEHSVGRFRFGSQVTDGGGTDNDSPQITVSTYAPIEIGSLWVNDCAGQSQVINCSGGVRTLQNITIDCGTF